MKVNSEINNFTIMFFSLFSSEKLEKSQEEQSLKDYFGDRYDNIVTCTDNSIILKNITHSEIPLQYTENEKYCIIRNNEAIYHLRLLSKDNEILYETEGSTIDEAREHKHNGFGKLYEIYGNKANLRYEGNFKNGGANGEGKFYIQNILIKEGLFKDGELIRGRHYVNDNFILEGIFKDGYLKRGNIHVNNQLKYQGSFIHYPVDGKDAVNAGYTTNGNYKYDAYKLKGYGKEFDNGKLIRKAYFK